MPKSSLDLDRFITFAMTNDEDQGKITHDNIDREPDERVILCDPQELSPLAMDECANLLACEAAREALFRLRMMWRACAECYGDEKVHSIVLVDVDATISALKAWRDAFDHAFRAGTLPTKED